MSRWLTQWGLREPPFSKEIGDAELWVPASRVGAMAMDRLRGLDHIAYIRFASVYQSFEDLADLKREVDRVIAERDDEGPTDPPRRRAARG